MPACNWSALKNQQRLRVIGHLAGTVSKQCSWRDVPAEPHTLLCALPNRVRPTKPYSSHSPPQASSSSTPLSACLLSPNTLFQYLVVRTFPRRRVHQVPLGAPRRGHPEDVGQDADRRQLRSFVQLRNQLQNALSSSTKPSPCRTAAVRVNDGPPALRPRSRNSPNWHRARALQRSLAHAPQPIGAGCCSPELHRRPCPAQPSSVCLTHCLSPMIARLPL